MGPGHLCSGGNVRTKTHNSHKKTYKLVIAIILLKGAIYKIWPHDLSVKCSNMNYHYQQNVKKQKC